MSELREYRYLWLPISLALLASINVYWYLSGLSSYETVIVAAHNIPPGTVIGPNMISSVEVHSTGVHPQSFQEREQVIGRISLSSIIAGEQLLLSKTSADPAYRGLSAQIGVGWRGFFVAAGGFRGLVGALVPGERVDVVYIDDEWRSHFVEASTIVTDATVLDVRDERGGSYSGGGDGLPAGVILLVSPEQAEILAHGQRTGTLYLTIAPAERR